MDDEEKRQAKDAGSWRIWGPYLTDRQWGTVREDYSADGRAWDFVSHEMARSKAYRWGEEGIGGISDDQQRLCFALSLWNGKDRILKERYFGLAGNRGNHGEDVKDYYYYLDNTPTHSYMKMLYKYPQKEFPYRELVEGNARRGKRSPEFELIDTGIFDEDRYFDVFIEYAKASPKDVCIRVSAYNRGPDEAVLNLLPTIWFRNTWAPKLIEKKPQLKMTSAGSIEAEHLNLGRYILYSNGSPEFLFCENETNSRRLYGVDTRGKGGGEHFKDGINDYVVSGKTSAVNASLTGTKAASHYRLSIAPGQHETIELRLANKEIQKPFADFDSVFKMRIEEADAFYSTIQKDLKNEDHKNIQRQAFGGLLWTKQYYYYDIPQWLNGDPGAPPPPKERMHGRNHDWKHLNNADIISMPDKWEYPWYAAWDLAFHCIPLAMVDREFAKHQLLLMTKEWYMHPNGQIPAYEWNFSDVNPPVHAWATWRVFQIDRKLNNGKGDFAFLERVYHKLLLNFTWWVNRKDPEGRNIFQGGFLGLDNIGVFDRSAPLPTGGHIDQADGTSWMAMYSLNLMRIALELSQHNPVYQDIATKFFEHFLSIAHAMTDMAGHGVGLWDEQDRFYYDELRLPNGDDIPLRVRSMVGLIPLFAVEVLDPETLKNVPDFEQRLKWFLNYRPDLAQLVSRWEEPGRGERRLLSLLRGSRIKALISRLLDESEFLSHYGVRALSKVHSGERPYVFNYGGERVTISYQPGESDSYMFGGNSNWRGPIWFPVNFLLIESLQRFHHYYGENFRIEYPVGSGKTITILEASEEISRRLIRIFERDPENGRRPVYGEVEKFQNDPHFRDYIWFYEYFHGDNGRGVGASHQTGWTALIAKLIQPRPKD